MFIETKDADIRARLNDAVQDAVRRYEQACKTPYTASMLAAGKECVAVERAAAAYGSHKPRRGPCCSSSYQPLHGVAACSLDT
jgi:hypothetical protein